MKPLSPSALDEIWLRMASRYGHAWVSQYGAEPTGFAGAEWRETLAGLSPEQLRAGFRADMLRGSEWPPSSTAFRAMCLQIPSLAAVQTEIDQYTSPGSDGGMGRFAAEVYRRLNVYAYRNSDNPGRLMRDAYSLARDYAMAGGELPAPARKLPAPEPKPRTPADPTVVRDGLERLRKMFGGAA